MSNPKSTGTQAESGDNAQYDPNQAVTTDGFKKGDETAVSQPQELTAGETVPADDGHKHAKTPGQKEDPKAASSEQPQSGLRSMFGLKKGENQPEGAAKE